MQITKHHNNKKYVAILRSSGEVDVRVFLDGYMVGTVTLESPEAAFDGVSSDSRGILQNDRDFAAKLSLLLYATK